MTWWAVCWRLLLALVISAMAWSAAAEYQLTENHRWLVIDLGLGLVSFVLVLWRRKYPVTITSILTLLSTVSLSSSGPVTLALVSLSTRRRWREILPLMGLSIVATITQYQILPADLRSDPFVTVLFTFAVIGVTVGWGMYIGSRRELLATLRDRADRAEAEQSLRVSQARAAERARIAREMHDVMAHRISLVTMHAGALAYRDNLDQEQVRQTASLIQATSHQALNELREVLGVLRDDTNDTRTDRPQPTGADIAELIEQSRQAGMRIQANVHVDLTALPVTIGRAMYRIVQESLTNAHKHAPGSAVLVDISGSPGTRITFHISNPASLEPTTVPGSGLGLVGLTERAELVGGRLDYTTAPDRTFAVEGWLPWAT